MTNPPVTSSSSSGASKLLQEPRSGSKPGILAPAPYGARSRSNSFANRERRLAPAFPWDTAAREDLLGECCHGRHHAVQVGIPARLGPARFGPAGNGPARLRPA